MVFCALIASVIRVAVRYGIIFLVAVRSGIIFLIAVRLGNIFLVAFRGESSDVVHGIASKAKRGELAKGATANMFSISYGKLPILTCSNIYCKRRT